MVRKLITDIAMPIMVQKGKSSLHHMEASAQDPMRENTKLLNKILRQNQNTEYGINHHFSDIHTLEDFRRDVPISTYEDFAPYIERIKNGENNILTKARVLGYSRTSGSSGYL